jgi:hypothetical protein
MEDVNIDGLAECMDLLRGAGYARCSMLQQCQHTATTTLFECMDRSAAQCRMRGTARHGRRCAVGPSGVCRRTGQRCVALRWGFGIRSGLLFCVGWHCNCLSTLNLFCCGSCSDCTDKVLCEGSILLLSQQKARQRAPVPSVETFRQCLVLGAGGAPYVSTLQLRSRCSCSTKQARNVSTQRLR